MMTLMKETFVKDIRPGEKVKSYFALRKSALLEKDGNYRLQVELGDETGRIPGVFWNANSDMGEKFKPGIIVQVVATVGTFMDKPQLTLQKIRPAQDDEYDLSDYFRKASKTRDELNALLDEMIERVENDYLRKLLDKIFGEEGIRDRYLVSPAGKLLHHDTIGGLAEHSLSMAEIAVRLADHYPNLNRDLLICGTLLHDIGKIWEYQVTAAIDYTDAGRLVGHISQGNEFVSSQAKTIEHFPEDLLTHIQHLILSHQGRREYGSPVVPMTPEAVFLYHIDELDSKMNAVEKIRERAGDTGWSEYSRTFERFFFFGRGGEEEASDE